jgi:hypothetical protein
VISRKTLYEDRRRAWRTLAPVIPGVVLRTICGYTALFRWILPREHWLSGTDWRFFPFSI